ncbi:hypothetical protein HELRODRAFT_159521 [Helobdella robusta]|uniref:Uncharacterized protein n=1 Tax=Helobdella robusta TaxID=6412 RepID=T1EP44_HELRO|nr:hypothetical protein HELRODRAFT_159521 [Helobdella robusta]ESO12932.1 hypothetical protein HELRODRAFT_159521 [Helobdella robusta]
MARSKHGTVTSSIKSRSFVKLKNTNNNNTLNSNNTNNNNTINNNKNTCHHDNTNQNNNISHNNNTIINTNYNNNTNNNDNNINIIKIYQDTMNCFRHQLDGCRGNEKAVNHVNLQTERMWIYEYSCSSTNLKRRLASLKTALINIHFCIKNILISRTI